MYHRRLQFHVSKTLDLLLPKSPTHMLLSWASLISTDPEAQAGALGVPLASHSPTQRIYHQVLAILPLESKILNLSIALHFTAFDPMKVTTVSHA